MALAAGRIEDPDEFINGLDSRTLRKWENLALIDDWSGEQTAENLARLHYVCVLIAAALGIPDAADLVATPNDFLAFRPRTDPRPQTLTAAESERRAAQDYGQ